MPEICPACGKNMDIVGRSHRCVPSLVVNNSTPIFDDRPFVINELTEDVFLPSANALRQAKWRKINSELNRQRAREGMRKRRQAEKANASA